MTPEVPWTVIVRRQAEEKYVIYSYDWIGPSDSKAAFSSAKNDFDNDSDCVDAIIKGSHYVIMAQAHAK
jgi:hypothetical protein